MKNKLKIEVRFPNGGVTATVTVLSDISFDTRDVKKIIQDTIDRSIHQHVQMIMFEGMNAIVSRKKK